MKTCRSTAFALAFGRCGVVAAPGNIFGLGTVAWADDCPPDVDDCITVTAKREKESALNYLQECRDGTSNIAQQLGCNSAMRHIREAEAAIAAAEAAAEACRQAKETVANNGFAAALGAVAGVGVRQACAALGTATGSPHAVGGTCVALVAAAVAACAVM